MTRKKAIEIVVANVGAGLPYKSWNVAFVSWTTFANERGWVVFEERGLPISKPSLLVKRWEIPRKWLEEKGYL